MENLPALFGILAALTVGVVSPGPSFVMVARTAVCASRREGIAAALGMGAGGVVFAVAALLGGLYLAYLGWRIWMSAAQPLMIGDLAERPATRTTRALALGFTTQISNPKTSIVYASVFAAFLPGAQSLAFDITLVVLVFVVEAGWYSLVALALASERPRSVYLRCKVWVDRLAGGVMIGLGLKLASSAQR